MCLARRDNAGAPHGSDVGAVVAGISGVVPRPASAGRAEIHTGFRGLPGPRECQVGPMLEGDSRQVGPSGSSPSPRPRLSNGRENSGSRTLPPACVTAPMMVALLLLWPYSKSPKELFCHVSAADRFLQMGPAGCSNFDR